MAAIGLSLGLDAFSSGMSLLQAHKVRAADATNENAAGNNAVSAYDKTIQQIVNAVNSGQVDVNTAIQYMEQFDQYIEQYLQKQVGKPGTAWNGSGVCNKQCTVGCCIYTNDLNPSTKNVIAALTQVQQAGGSATATIQKVYPSKYGLSGRDAYTVTFSPPNIQSISSAASTVATSVTRPIRSALQALGLASSVGPTVTTSGNYVPGIRQSSSVLLYVALAVGAVLLLVFTRGK